MRVSLLVTPILRGDQRQVRFYFDKSETARIRSHGPWMAPSGTLATGLTLTMRSTFSTGFYKCTVHSSTGNMSCSIPIDTYAGFPVHAPSTTPITIQPKLDNGSFRLRPLASTDFTYLPPNWRETRRRLSSPRSPKGNGPPLPTTTPPGHLDQLKASVAFINEHLPEEAVMTIEGRKLRIMIEL